MVFDDFSLNLILADPLLVLLMHKLLEIHGVRILKLNQSLAQLGLLHLLDPRNQLGMIDFVHRLLMLLPLLATIDQYHVEVLLDGLTLLNQPLLMLLNLPLPLGVL